MRRSSLFFALLAISSSFVPAPAAQPESNPKKQVLFVCTGNYYRSRFAEALFNYYAQQMNLDWTASSRGLRVKPDRIGISPLAREELDRRKIPKELYTKNPQSLRQNDLDQSEYVVVMDETEHRPMVDEQFPDAQPRMHYWHVPDIEQMPSPKAFETISANVDRLLKELTKEQKQKP